MADVAAAWNSPRQVCIVLDNHSLHALAEDLQLDADKIQVLATTPTDVVVVNRE
jgi:hypothetical protein